MKKTEHRKMIIIGAGPAGLTAGIYSARAGLEPLIIENAAVGGQMSSGGIVENYPGVPEIGGGELSTLMRRQAEKQGAFLEQFDPFVCAKLSGREKVVETENCRYICDSVIIAAGASPKKLPAKGEQLYRGRGVHYCAVCDGFAYRGAQVGVVGGGNSALEDALYLSGICENVTIFCRSDAFSAQNRLVEAVGAAKNIRVEFLTEVTELGGGEMLEYIETNRGRRMLSGLFCRIGSVPNSEPFAEVNLSERGYIITDLSMRTDIPHVYAAGDIREKECRQIITAAADGAIAALTAQRESERR